MALSGYFRDAGTEARAGSAVKNGGGAADDADEERWKGTEGIETRGMFFLVPKFVFGNERELFLSICVICGPFAFLLSSGDITLDAYRAELMLPT